MDGDVLKTFDLEPDNFIFTLKAYPKRVCLVKVWCTKVACILRIMVHWSKLDSLVDKHILHVIDLNFGENGEKLYITVIFIFAYATSFEG